MSGRNLGDAKRDPAEQKAGDQSKGDDRHGLRPQIGLVAGSSTNMRAIQDIGRVRNLARPRDGRTGENRWSMAVPAKASALEQCQLSSL
jgi:hypothetical protein